MILVSIYCYILSPNTPIFIRAGLQKKLDSHRDFSESALRITTSKKLLLSSSKPSFNRGK